ncbi:uncharacterized protein EHS24_006333 [Apiotrichum porosum]|uniref:Extracellular membrane protein CFEM domain-containing protein n=1 Tax=Apiotrichum porosum TaxID=105984 RepID=A0A427Y0Y9_9TREE|nr:uncharacterized protein EHS24_006333 [Apiotrichum porosum]RSH84806.1 hypothetical protein EHS24_006333 [Apiotrichum porosum]
MLVGPALLASALAATVTPASGIDLTARQASLPIPSQCQSQCATLVKYYNACLIGDTATCIGVCNELSAVTTCTTCVTGGGSYSELNSAMSELEQACAMDSGVTSSSAVTSAGIAPSAVASAGVISGTSRATGVVTSAAGAGASVVSASAAGAASASTTAAGAQTNTGFSVSSVSLGAVGIALAAYLL